MPPQWIILVLMVAANLHAQYLSPVVEPGEQKAKTLAYLAIKGILPRSNLLLVNWSRESKESPREQGIEVGESGIAGAPLQLHGSFSLPGKVTIAGGADVEFPRLSVRLTPEDGNSSDVTADVTKDATFTLTELRPTTYELRLIGLPDGWYLRSAVFGEENVLSEGLKLSEGYKEHSLQIGISLGAAKVRGIVVDQEFQDPVANAVVKLFPDPPNPHRADVFRTAPTNEDGSFTIENVVPGKYRVLAVMGKGGSENADDSLIAAASGVRVVLAEKQSKYLELELFEAHR